MAVLQDIFDSLCRFAPLELQLGFDNSGLLVGHLHAQIDKILVALDITEEVIEEAIAEHAQLIVSHHPVIWDPVKSLTDGGGERKLLRMIENHMAAICMHTNLDIVQGGVNDVLMSILGAKAEAALDADGCGRVGYLPTAIPLGQFLRSCKTALNANGLRYYDAGKPVYHLAVMGGSGSDAIEDACRAGCDTYVTSDIKYHQFQRAMELGINLIDADHFCTENPIVPVLADFLRQQFPGVTCIVSQRHKQLISFL